MSDKVMSRRKFLAGAGAVVGAATVSGLALAERPDAAHAAGTALPWPYPTDPAVQPDPKTVARRSFEIYYQSGCSEATWRSIVEALAPMYPETWGTLPNDLFWYGRGGTMEMGTLCGTLNGSIAIVAATLNKPRVADADKISRGLASYYAETPMPTNAVDRDVADGWVPSGPNVKPVLPNAPTSIANSPLCHASLAQWTMMTGNNNGSAPQKDRCAKLCYDMTLKTVTILNQYFSSATVPPEEVDPVVATCMACHTPNAKGSMSCDSCHENTFDHWKRD